MARTQKAIFAAGCFWGVQYYFDQVPGVLKTVAGYTGGHTDNPSYEDVLTHSTGHAEALEIEFDPGKVTYQTLLKHFFRMHNPTLLNKADEINEGENYRSAIFYTNPEQKELAEAYIRQLEAARHYDKPIVTEVVPAKTFYDAEDYHQKFSERTGRGICHIPYAPVD